MAHSGILQGMMYGYAAQPIVKLDQMWGYATPPHPIPEWHNRAFFQIDGRRQTTQPQMMSNKQK
jgi:hypothetical protein